MRVFSAKNRVSQCAALGPDSGISDACLNDTAYCRDSLDKTQKICLALLSGVD